MEDNYTDFYFEYGEPDLLDQAMFLEWADEYSKEYPILKMLFAVPKDTNPSNNNTATVFDEKKDGLPDICLPISDGEYHSLWIIVLPREFYSYKTDKQYWWMENLSEEGCLVIDCNGWDQARNVVINYLADRQKKNKTVQIHFEED